MNFSDDYFEDEVRDGFYVPGLMKSAWAAQLQVLSEIDRVCKKHGITWFAEYGTMLGAVRHNGFIPWDDDLDICMLRPDYEKFCEIAVRELPPEYDVLSIFTNSRVYKEYITRINNGKEISTEPETLKKRQRCPYVLGIDIFCLDYLPQDEEKASVIRRGITIATQILQSLETANVDLLAIWEQVQDSIKELEVISGEKIILNENFRKQLHLINEKLFSSVNEKDAKKVGIMADWFNSEGSRGYPKEYFEDVVFLDFENIKMPVPVGYNYILKDKYGDYMRLVRSGGGHDYRFQDQIEKFEEVAGPAAYKYSPTAQELVRAFDRKEREQYRNTKHNVACIIDCFKTVNAQVAERITDCDLQAAADLLVQCQNNVIEVGNLIDGIESDLPVIHVLEEYCEVIYNCYNNINAVMADNYNEQILLELSDNILRELNIICQRSVAAVLEDMSPNRTVIFIPYKYENWEQFKSIYEEEKSRKDTKIFIVVPPYYTKMPDGTRINTIDENSYFSEITDVVPYDSFDFANNYADVIYIQNPYDQYNYSVSVHPFFYSSNIWKYTEKLIYIPCFREDDFGTGDERAYISMDSYVTMPGPIYSDEVWLSSENLKRNYLRKLQTFLEEHGVDKETYIITLRDKIRVINNASGLLVSDCSGNNAADKGRKLVLFSNSLSTILEYGYACISKIKRVLEIFYNQKDNITLVWMPDVNIEKNLDRIDSELYSEYHHIVEQYKTSAWGLYSDQKDELYMQCSAYYGDPGSLAQKCRRLGKPVMIMNFEV